MKKILRKWWFWIIVLIICSITYIAISSFVEGKKVKESISNIGNSASNFIDGVDNAQTHIDEFSYNNKTGKVEYRASKITLEMYNKIEEGMSQDKVISILGQYEDILNGENTYILEWGNEYSVVYDGYWIQITFNIDEKKVLRKHQFGLK